MLVSVISDASYCPEYKVTGMACWVKSNRTTRGVFKAGVRDDPRIISSTLAELGAAVMGVHVAVRTKVAHYGDTLLIQSDCTGIERYILNPALISNKSPLQIEREMVDVLVRNMNDYGLRYRFKHVKGHQSKDLGGRFAVNVMCDREAYKLMKKRREIVKERNERKQEKGIPAH